MAEPFDVKTPPGTAAFWDNYSTASKSMQSFAAEMQRVSKENLDASTQFVEALRGAKSFEDVVAIQTSFMQKSLSTYADATRRFSEMMMTMPMEFAKHGRAALQQGADAMVKATHEVGEQMHQASEEFNKSHG